MSEEIKPCPFCGSEARFGSLDGGSVTVWCHAECGAELVRGTEAGAITAWNTRTTDARITSLEEVLEQAATWFEEYAAEHYRKAKNAPDGREQHGREVKGKLNKERADILCAALSVRGEG